MIIANLVFGKLDKGRPNRSGWANYTKTITPPKTELKEARLNVIVNEIDFVNVTKTNPKQFCKIHQFQKSKKMIFFLSPS